MTGGPAAEQVAGAMLTARRLARMTTRQFASAICAGLNRRSLHPSTVSKWEHGVVTPPADVLVAAARVANVPIQVLFDGMSDRAQPSDRVNRLEERLHALTHRVDRLWIVVDPPGA
jgi:transcriptional regulator with XRE-family HTH domain